MLGTHKIIFRRPKAFQRPLVKEVHRNKFSAAEHRPVIENAGQILRLFERIDLDKIRVYSVFLAEFAIRLDAPGDKRALRVIIDGQFLLSINSLFAFSAKRGFVPSKDNASSS